MQKKPVIFSLQREISAAKISSLKFNKQRLKEAGSDQHSECIYQPTVSSEKEENLFPFKLLSSRKLAFDPIS